MQYRLSCNPTWEETALDEVGTIYRDWFENNIRCLVMRGPASLCAYLGIPLNHPLANFNYNDIPLNVHGGLTFGAFGDNEYRPIGYFWYGWDYAHAGDCCFYYNKYPYLNSDDKKWLVNEVEKEIKEVLWDFEKLVTLAEKITNKKL